MSPTPAQWRFQWPDGTWIRWNPDTEAWEKEKPSEGGDARNDSSEIAPEERWILDNMAPPPATAAGDVAVDETDDPVAELGDDVDRDVDDARDADWNDHERDDVALGPRRSAARVISTEEEPKSSLRPTIYAGAAVGLAVGIVISLLLR